MKMIPAYTASRSLVDHERQLDQQTNPFVDLPSKSRALIVVYVLLYNVLLPVIDVFVHGSADPLIGGRLLAQILYQLLFLLPIIVYLPSYGLFHPLVFATAYSVAFSIARNPDNLLLPLQLLDHSSLREFQHVALYGWNKIDVSIARLEVTLLNIIALSTYYFGFFVIGSRSVAKIRFLKPVRVGIKATSLIIASVLIFILYLQFEGGLSTHILSWRYGRFEALAGDGPVLVLIRVGFLACLAWFSLAESAYRNPAFWLGLLVSLTVQFLSTGSRSAVLFGVAILLMIWIIRTQKIPNIKIILLAAFGFVLFGLLGQFRSSLHTEQVDWSLLTDVSVVNSIQAAAGETDWWEDNSGSLAVVAHVPDEVDFLYGRTYIAALTFFIPRAVWPEKPRGAGALNGELIFNKTGGVPTGAVGEAYWNFHVPGVILVFLLYGIFHSWLAGSFRRYAHLPSAWILYVLTLFYFAPATTSMVKYFQYIIPTIAILWWMRAIRFTDREDSSYVPA